MRVSSRGTDPQGACAPTDQRYRHLGPAASGMGACVCKAAGSCSVDVEQHTCRLWCLFGVWRVCFETYGYMYAHHSGCLSLSGQTPGSVRHCPEISCQREREPAPGPLTWYQGAAPAIGIGPSFTLDLSHPQEAALRS